MAGGFKVPMLRDALLYNPSLFVSCYELLDCSLGCKAVSSAGDSSNGILSRTEQPEGVLECKSASKWRFICGRH